jgi:hypothetical protein
MQGEGTSADHDWTFEVTDRIESAVSVVRDRATKPIVMVARAVVYGFIAAVLVLVLVTLLVIGVVRILDAYLPITPESRKIWVVDMITAAMFLGSGAFLLRMGRPKPPTIDVLAGNQTP